MALTYQGQSIDLNGLNRLLQASPTYQQALRGQWWPDGMPHTPGFKAEALRAAAQKDGITIPGGAIDPNTGKVSDPNADHWYSDPRVLGPTAVAAAATLGILAAPAAAAGGGAGGASSLAPTASQLGQVSALEHATTLAVPTVGASVGSTLTQSLLNYGIPIAGQVIGGILQNKAINSSERAQADALDKALAAEKERDAYNRASDAEQRMYDRAKYDESTNYGRNTYANYIKTLEPFRQTGTAANDRMGQILGLNFTPNSGTTYPQLADQADTPSNLSQQYRPLSTGLQGQLVTMVAPNGETSQVPNELVDHYMQLGARRA